MMKTKQLRESHGLRFTPDLWSRVQAVADKQHTNPRSVIEQCLERSLPVLEQIYGIELASKKVNGAHRRPALVGLQDVPY